MSPHTIGHSSFFLFRAVGCVQSGSIFFGAKVTLFFRERRKGAGVEIFVEPPFSTLVCPLSMMF